MFLQPGYGFDGGSPAFSAGYAAAVDLDPDTILSPADVARAWGLTPAAVRNMIIAGDLPAEQDERGYYQVRAAELERRTVVTEVTPTAQLGKVPVDHARHLRDLHDMAAELLERYREAMKTRDRYIAELVNVERLSPTDVGRQLPGEGDAEHMSRATVNRIAKEHRDG